MLNYVLPNAPSVKLNANFHYVDEALIPFPRIILSILRHTRTGKLLLSSCMNTSYTIGSVRPNGTSILIFSYNILNYQTFRLTLELSMKVLIKILSLMKKFFCCINYKKLGLLRGCVWKDI